VIVASRPRISFDQMAAPVPEIMDTASHQLCHRLFPKDTDVKDIQNFGNTAIIYTVATLKIWTRISDISNVKFE
jgi:hypothetical protein